MRIGDLFDTRVEEKIEPVIKVGDIRDEHKLAEEIGSYVVTPTIERYLDDFLEHYTDSIHNPTNEIGVWISGYFGSGKSYLAKMLALLVENRELDGLAASKRFESRLPSDAPHRESILRSLYRISQCHSQVLASNINTLADSKTTPLPRLLISQYYQSKGYSSNILYANVIEAELDKRGKLEDLHKTVEVDTNKPWVEIQRNPGFYRKHLYDAVCKVAPEIFSSPEEVDIALRNAEKGELFNVQFFIRTILDDLKVLEGKTGKPCRIVLVLDESGQWIENDAGRLYQLQALVEEAAKEGNGKIWIAVTTHEDIGSIYQNARALTADMKKIESRFRFKFSLTTENIELVLKDRIFKKKLAGRDEVSRVYEKVSGELRGLGELSNSGQKLPSCTEENFVTFYPFFPYQIHLIPEIVKSLRSHGGKGEQLSGSTRTLLAITQDILRAGRRPYLKLGIGEMVSFDEIYDNLAGGAEIPPDVRRELSRIEDVVPEAVPLTRKVAEVLYLIGEVPYIPRTIDNIARLLVEATSDDLPSLISKLEPELKRLTGAKLVAPIGEEYEFLTGERRNLEEAVRTVQAQLKQQDREKGISNFATIDVLGFSAIPYKNTEFPENIYFDDTPVIKKGFIEIRVYSPLSALSGLKVADLEDRSLQHDESQTIFVLSDRIPGFDKDLDRYLAMQEVVNDWKGDPYKSEEARKLAAERESNDLRKLRDKVRSEIDDGLRHAHLIFHGSSRTVTPKASQTVGEALRSEIAAYWPTLYPKYDKVPVRITHDQRAISDVLKGSKALSPEVLQLKLFDKAGQLNPQSPLLDAIRIFLTTRQSQQRRTLGKDLIDEFIRPPYRWDSGAIRVGVAAFVRSGAVSILINKKPYRNPADPELQAALRASRKFNMVELILEEIKIDPDVLIEVRKLLIELTGVRKIDETSAALSLSFEDLGKELLAKAAKVSVWARPADFPFPDSFREGKEKIQEILDLTNPMSRVSEIHAHKEILRSGSNALRALAAFHEKWGAAYTEMNGFAVNLNGIEHRLPKKGACKNFLHEFRTAKNTARIADSQVWKDLQDAKAQANLELAKLIGSWREDARKKVEETLDRLPEMLKANGLDPELIPELSKPLTDFLDSLDDETAPTRVAALSDRGELLAQKMRTAIMHEIQEKQKLPKGPQKPVETVRVADVSLVQRIKNVEEWDRIRDKLDDKVKNILKKGKEVELV
jgi:hypothetical protein